VIGASFSDTCRDDPSTAVSGLSLRGVSDLIIGWGGGGGVDKPKPVVTDGGGGGGGLVGAERTGGDPGSGNPQLVGDWWQCIW